MYYIENINFKKIAQFLALALITISVHSAYSGNRLTVSTFINNQSRAVIADDLFNACRSSCPTQSQTPYSKFDFTRQTTTPISKQVPPSYLLPTMVAVLMTALYIGWIVKKIIMPTRSLQSLYAQWRD